MENRVDIVLVERGLATTRTQAQKMIRNEQVKTRYIDGLVDEWRLLKKPSFKIYDDAELEVSKGAEQRYVSRAGLKLEHALKTLAMDVEGLIALDIGQSTGGFTDCLIQHGCKKVFGIDVGSSQLHDSLKLDPRVESFEGVNARHLSTELFTDSDIEGFDLMVMDVSFISQTLILPQLEPLMNKGCTIISLVKPQFEVGRGGVGKGGLVKSDASYPIVEEKIKTCIDDPGLSVKEYFDSDILGGDGNREFFVVARKVN